MTLRPLTLPEALAASLLVALGWRPAAARRAATTLTPAQVLTMIEERHDEVC
jgi:hypothetical protein